MWVNLPFKRSKNWSQLFITQEFAFPNLLIDSLERFPLFYCSDWMSPFYSFGNNVWWEECVKEHHVLWLTFLGLPLCASGLEPILFQAQLVEKCFALKGGKCVDFDTHSYCLRTLGISLEQQNNVFSRKEDNSPNTQTSVSKRLASSV